MTVKELKKLIESLPDDVVVGYKNGNFGGMDEELTTNDLDWVIADKLLLIRSPFWEPVD